MSEGTNYVALCITLSIAIFIGNGMLLVADKIWQNYQLEQVTKAMNASTKKLQAETVKRINANRVRQLEAEIKRGEQDKIRKTQRERSTNAARIKKETCTFWQSEFRKQRSSYNQTMMSSACGR